MAAAPESIEEVLLTGHSSGTLYPSRYPVRLLADRQFAAISGAKTPQGVAAVVRMPEDSWAPSLPAVPGRRVLLLEGVQDPGNVGALVRTAAAFGYDGMVLTMESADPFSPKAVQASAGSILSLWIRRTERWRDLANALTRADFSLIAADVKGGPVAPSGFGVPHCLLLGSEGTGLSTELLSRADAKVRIPLHEQKAQSLNVAAAGAILMYLGSSLR